MSQKQHFATLRTFGFLGIIVTLIALGLNSCLKSALLHARQDEATFPLSDMLLAARAVHADTQKLPTSLSQISEFMDLRGCIYPSYEQCRNGGNYKVVGGMSFISSSGGYRITMKTDADQVFFFAVRARPDDDRLPVAACFTPGGTALNPFHNERLITSTSTPPVFYDIDNHPACSKYTSRH